MPRLDASALRANLYDVLKHLDTPVEICRNGRLTAVLSLPAATAQKPRVDQRRVARVCQRHRIRCLALFGSVTREDFGPTSDVDVLVDITPGTRRTLDTHVAMCDALEDLFGRDVDLHYADDLAQCKNAHIKASVTEDLRVIYEA